MCGTGTVRGGKAITLVISNKNMHDIIEIIKSLENSSLLIDGVSEIVKHKIGKQKGRFIGMLLGTLGASML